MTGRRVSVRGSGKMRFLSENGGRAAAKKDETLDVNGKVGAAEFGEGCGTHQYTSQDHFCCTWGFFGSLRD